MTKIVETPGIGKLNLRDLAIGLGIAVGSSVINIVYQTVEAGSLTFNWKQIATVALSSGLAYILKNVFDKSKTVITGAPDANVQVTDKAGNVIAEK